MRMRSTSPLHRDREGVSHSVFASSAVGRERKSIQLTPTQQRDSEITLRACAGVQISKALAVVSKFIKPPWKVRPPLERPPTRPLPPSPCAVCACHRPRPSAPATIRALLSVQRVCGARRDDGGPSLVAAVRLYSCREGQWPMPRTRRISCARTNTVPSVLRASSPSPPTVLLLLCAFTQPPRVLQPSIRVSDRPGRK